MHRWLVLNTNIWKSSRICISNGAGVSTSCHTRFGILWNKQTSRDDYIVTVWTTASTIIIAIGDEWLIACDVIYHLSNVHFPLEHWNNDGPRERCRLPIYQHFALCLTFILLHLIASEIMVAKLKMLFILLRWFSFVIDRQMQFSLLH